MIAIAKVRVGIMFIAQVVVDNKRCAVERFPLYILLELSTTIVLDIVVGQIANITLGRLDRGNATIAEPIGRSQLQCEPTAYIHIDK